MVREALEKHQVWMYLGAAALGLGVGLLHPQAGDALEPAVWPLLGVLLYTTFIQVPLVSIARGFTDVRFLIAALTGNFLILPLLVWGLAQLAPVDEPVRLGLLLVLLVPCTDWFITFTQLGRGDASRATALTPLLLIVQFALLPGYLWLMAGDGFSAVFSLQQLWPALLVVFVPLALAGLSDVWFARRPRAGAMRESLGAWPVPLLALVIAVIAASHAGAVPASLRTLPVVVLVSLAFLVLSLALARTLTVALRLAVRPARTLAFTFGTRNSFIVLPFALSLPAGWEMTAIVVVMQSLVELLSMAVCVWFVPRVLLKSPRPERESLPR